MHKTIYWFRQDLRLADQPALVSALRDADALIPLYVVDHRHAETTSWGFDRMGPHRRAVLKTALQSLDAQLRARGSRLWVMEGDPCLLIPRIVDRLGIGRVYVEKVAAPEEAGDVHALRGAGIHVEDHWQSSLIAPESLPFAINDLPEVFTTFRSRIEKHGVTIQPPIQPPASLPPSPDIPHKLMSGPSMWLDHETPPPDRRSSFPYTSGCCRVDEPGAHRYLTHYLSRKLPHTYKTTRNGLTGVDFSSKWSPYLALGTISARQLMAALRDFETQHGANEGTYWLWFELLWRDYFRLLHLKHGIRLYRAAGLNQQATLPRHDQRAFERWRHGTTGHPLVDAGMRELAATGYLSNRMRQIVASYLIHDLNGDWRAGAAWFESLLIDYDVYSNQGNWLYLAGRGTDPRGGRRFNPDKQAADYDPDGHYRQLWSAP